VGNEITFGAIAKPIVCVHLLNTNLKKSRVGLMKYNFKRRMGEMEGMLMTYNFESMWQ